ncbi:hypothetical protein F2Q68_00017966 [Brassica cretica]|uniref:Uncharacterized protein n=1 Tax=Brassica cretica TaxID=69181 RepID=A0A8S9HP82_BRACR|nr:hypothetical protein F2Q68_00017966 [Brassica cretica]
MANFGCAILLKRTITNSSTDTYRKLPLSENQITLPLILRYEEKLRLDTTDLPWRVNCVSQGSRNGRYPNSSHRNPSRVLRSWVSDLEKKRQKLVRESFWYHGGPEDLREKMWSDFKVVKMWSDLKKKMSSFPEGVKMLSDLGDKACSELREKTSSDPGEMMSSDLEDEDAV